MQGAICEIPSALVASIESSFHKRGNGLRKGNPTSSHSWLQSNDNQDSNATDVTVNIHIENKNPLGKYRYSYFTDEETEHRDLYSHPVPVVPPSFLLMSQNCCADQQYWGAGNPEFPPEERGLGLPLLPCWSGSLSGSKKHLLSVDVLRAQGPCRSLWLFLCLQKAAADVLRPQSSAGKTWDGR